MADDLTGKAPQDNPYANITPKMVLTDPKFHGLDMETRRFVLGKIDPDFSGLGKADQDQALGAGLDYWNKYFAPPPPPTTGEKIEAGVKSFLGGLKGLLGESPAQAEFEPPKPPPMPKGGKPSVRELEPPPGTIPTIKLGLKPGEAPTVTPPTFEEAQAQAEAQIPRGAENINFQIAQLDTMGKAMDQQMDELEQEATRIDRAGALAQTSEQQAQLKADIELYNKSLEHLKNTQQAYMGRRSQIQRLVGMAGMDRYRAQAEAVIQAHAPMPVAWEAEHPLQAAALEVLEPAHKLLNTPIVDIGKWNKQWMADQPPSLEKGVQQGVAEFIGGLTSIGSIASLGALGSALSWVRSMSPALKMAIELGFTAQMGTAAVLGSAAAIDAYQKGNNEEFGREMVLALGDAAFAFLAGRGFTREAMYWGKRFANAARRSKEWKFNTPERGLPPGPEAPTAEPGAEPPARALPPAPRLLEAPPEVPVVPTTREMGGTVLSEMEIAQKAAEAQAAEAPRGPLALPPAPGQVTLPGGAPIPSLSAPIIPGEEGGLGPFRRMELTVPPGTGLQPPPAIDITPVPESDRPFDQQDFESVRLRLDLMKSGQLRRPKMVNPALLELRLNDAMRNRDMAALRRLRAELGVERPAEKAERDRQTATELGLEPPPPEEQLRGRFMEMSAQLPAEQQIPEMGGFTLKASVVPGQGLEPPSGTVYDQIEAQRRFFTSLGVTTYNPQLPFATELGIATRVVAPGFGTYTEQGAKVPTTEVNYTVHLTDPNATRGDADLVSALITKGAGQSAVGVVVSRNPNPEAAAENHVGVEFAKPDGTPFTPEEITKVGSAAPVSFETDETGTKLRFTMWDPSSPETFFNDTMKAIQAIGLDPRNGHPFKGGSYLVTAEDADAIISRERAGRSASGRPDIPDSILRQVATAFGEAYPRQAASLKWRGRRAARELAAEVDRSELDRAPGPPQVPLPFGEDAISFPSPYTPVGPEDTISSVVGAPGGYRLAGRVPLSETRPTQPLPPASERGPYNPDSLNKAFLAVVRELDSDPLKPGQTRGGRIVGKHYANSPATTIELSDGTLLRVRALDRYGLMGPTFCRTAIGSLALRNWMVMEADVVKLIVNHLNERYPQGDWNRAVYAGQEVDPRFKDGQVTFAVNMDGTELFGEGGPCVVTHNTLETLTNVQALRQLGLIKPEEVTETIAATIVDTLWHEVFHQAYREDDATMESLMMRSMYENREAVKTIYEHVLGRLKENGGELLSDMGPIFVQYANRVIRAYKGKGQKVNRVLWKEIGNVDAAALDKETPMMGEALAPLESADLKELYKKAPAQPLPTVAMDDILENAGGRNLDDIRTDLQKQAKRGGVVLRDYQIEKMLQDRLRREPVRTRDYKVKWIAPSKGEQTNPIVDQIIGIDKREALMKRMVKRDENTGAPVNKRMVFETGDPRMPQIVVGDITFDDWINTRWAILTPKERKDAAMWYNYLLQAFTKVFGAKDAPRYLMAWGASQANTSASGGLMNLLRAMDAAVGFKTRLAGIADRQIKAILAGKDVDAGFALKLMDFSDCIWEGPGGKKKVYRTAMNNDPRGLRMFVTDTHTAQSMGFVSKKMTGYFPMRYWVGDRQFTTDKPARKLAAKLGLEVELKAGEEYVVGDKVFSDRNEANAFAVANNLEVQPRAEWTPGWLERIYGQRGKEFAAKLQVDMGGAVTEAQYQWSTEKGNRFCDELNRRRFGGRSDWTPMEVQAIDWTGFQKLRGRVPEFAHDIFDKNTYAFPLLAAFDPQSPMGKAFPEMNRLSYTTRQRILDKAVRDVAPKIAESCNVFTVDVVPGAQLEVPPQDLPLFKEPPVYSPATVFNVLGSPESARSFASAIGLAFNQPQVSLSRIMKSGSRMVFTVTDPTGKHLVTEESQKEFQTRLADKLGELASIFLPYRSREGSGVQTFQRGGNWSKEQQAAFVSAVQKVCRDMEIPYKDLLKDFDHVDIEDFKNNWAAEQEGDRGLAFRGVLRALGRERIAGEVDSLFGGLVRESIAKSIESDPDAQAELAQAPSVRESYATGRDPYQDLGTRTTALDLKRGWIAPDGTFFELIQYEGHIQPHEAEYLDEGIDDVTAEETGGFPVRVGLLSAFMSGQPDYGIQDSLYLEAKGPMSPAQKRGVLDFINAHKGMNLKWSMERSGMRSLYGDTEGGRMGDMWTALKGAYPEEDAQVAVPPAPDSPVRENTVAGTSHGVPDDAPGPEDVMAWDRLAADGRRMKATYVWLLDKDGKEVNVLSPVKFKSYGIETERERAEEIARTSTVVFTDQDGIELGRRSYDRAAERTISSNEVERMFNPRLMTEEEFYRGGWERLKLTSADTRLRVPTRVLMDDSIVSTERGPGARTRDRMLREPEYIDKLKAKIDAEGLTEGIAIDVDPDGTVHIIDGTHRLMIAHELGIKSVPVEMVPHAIDKGGAYEFIKKYALHTDAPIYPEPRGAELEEPEDVRESTLAGWRWANQDAGWRTKERDEFNTDIIRAGGEYHVEYRLKKDLERSFDRVGSFRTLKAAQAFADDYADYLMGNGERPVSFDQKYLDLELPPPRESTLMGPSAPSTDIIEEIKGQVYRLEEDGKTVGEISKESNPRYPRSGLWYVVRMLGEPIKYYQTLSQAKAGVQNRSVRESFKAGGVDLSGAIARRNVEPDGTIYRAGNKVQPTDEVLAEVQDSVGGRIAENESIIAQMKELIAQGKGNDVNAVRALLPNDSRATSAQDAINTRQSVIRNSREYLKDVEAANRALKAAGVRESFKGSSLEAPPGYREQEVEAKGLPDTLDKAALGRPITDWAAWTGGGWITADGYPLEFTFYHSRSLSEATGIPEKDLREREVLNKVAAKYGLIRLRVGGLPYGNQYPGVEVFGLPTYAQWREIGQMQKEMGVPIIFQITDPATSAIMASGEGLVNLRRAADRVMGEPGVRESMMAGSRPDIITYSKLGRKVELEKMFSKQFSDEGFLTPDGTLYSIGMGNLHAEALAKAMNIKVKGDMFYGAGWRNAMRMTGLVRWRFQPAILKKAGGTIPGRLQVEAHVPPTDSQMVVLDKMNRYTDGGDFLGTIGLPYDEKKGYQQGDVYTWKDYVQKTGETRGWVEKATELSEPDDTQKMRTRQQIFEEEGLGPTREPAEFPVPPLGLEPPPDEQKYMSDLWARKAGEELEGETFLRGRRQTLGGPPATQPPRPRRQPAAGLPPPPDYEIIHGLETATGGRAETFLEEAFRSLFTGKRDAKVAEGNQTRDKVADVLKDPVQRKALLFFREFRNLPPIEIERVINGTHDWYREYSDYLMTEKGVPPLDAARMANEARERVRKLEPYLRQALNPTPEMLQADSMLTDYWREKLDEGIQNGFLRSSITPAEYSTHILIDDYPPDRGEGMVTNETGGAMPKNFTFAKKRTFGNLVKAIIFDKKPATIDVIDAMTVYNQAHSKVLATRQFIQSLQENDVLRWGVRRSEHIPKDWIPYTKMRNKLWEFPVSLTDARTGQPVDADFVAWGPRKIVEALYPVTDPNFFDEIAGMRKMRVYQAYLKSVQLGLSLFHMKALMLSAMSNMNPVQAVRALQANMFSPEFQAGEVDAAKYGCTTDIQGRYVETRRAMARELEGPDFMDKIANLPLIKQGSDFAQTIAHYMFGVMQRKFKVIDFQLQKASYLAKNPNATEGEQRIALTRIARQINGAYGGLHWENMGWNKSTVAATRAILLAPDWTYSNVLTVGSAFEPGQAGTTARKHWALAFGIGMALTAAFTFLNTGHLPSNPTRVEFGKDKNGKEVSSSIFFAGAPNDLVNLANNVWQLGLVAGLAQSFGNKMAPVLRYLVQTVTNRDWAGKAIVPKGSGVLVGTARSAWHAMKTMGPVPFSISTAGEMLWGKDSSSMTEYLAAILLAARMSRRVPEGERERTSGYGKGTTGPASKGPETSAWTRITSGRMNLPSQQSFARMPLDLALTAYEQADEETRKMYLPLLVKKLSTIYKFRSQEVRDDIMDRLRDLKIVPEPGQGLQAPPP